MSYRFGAFELDLRRYELRRAGQVVPVQRKVFEVLRYLIEHRDRLVTKQELLDTLWPDEVVTEAAVPWSISHLRKALDQPRGATEPIQTAHGRGYRFTAQIAPLTDAEPPPPPAASSRAPSTAPTTAPTTAPSAPAGEPFVGREAPMRELGEVLAACRQGSGAFVLLTGEPGIGKTRCAEEFSRVAEAQGVQIWTGRALEGDDVPAFWPWIQILRAAAGTADASEMLARLMPRGEPEPPAADDRGARFWLLDALGRVVLDAARTAPRVLVLDDLHWADTASLEALLLVVMELRTAPLVVLATARSAELHRRLQQERVLSRLLRHGRRIELLGLRREDVAAYARAFGAPDDDAVAAALRQKTGGVPLFLEEVLRHWRRAGATDPGSLLDGSVPALARDMVTSHLARLGQGTRATLELASVIGTELELSLLLGGGTEPALVLKHLDELVSERLLLPLDTPGHYAFASDVVREVVYGELPAARRTELHLAVADSLDRLGLDGERLRRAAAHLYHALPLAEPGRLELLARRAARAAWAVHAYADAARCLGWALAGRQLAATRSPALEAALLIELARAELLAGLREQARVHLESALELAKAHDLFELLVRIGTLLRATLALAFTPEPLALVALEVALDRLPQDERRLRALAHSALARTPPHSLSPAKSRELHRQAVDLARGADHDTLIAVLHASLTALGGPTNLDEALAVTEQIAQTEGAAPKWRDAEVALARYFRLLTRGDIVAAEGALAKFGRLAARLELAEAVWHHDRYHLELRFARGDLAAVREALPALAHRAERMRLPLGLAYAPIQTLLVAREASGAIALGDYEWAKGALGPASLSVGFTSMLARLSCEAGQVEASRALLRRLVRGDLDLFRTDQSYLSAVMHLLFVAATLGERQLTEELASALEPFSELYAIDGFGFCIGATSQALGVASAALGRPAQASERFEHALASNRRGGFALEEVRTQLCYVEALDSGRAKGTVRTRRAVAREAAETARRLGLAQSLRKAERYL